MEQRPIPTKVTPLRKPQRTQEEQDATSALFEVAPRDSGQPRYIAAFLLGLYNGSRFPFTAG